MKVQSKSNTMRRFIAMPVAALILFAPVEAMAVKKVCKHDVCSRTTWDGRRVTIYFASDGPSLTSHFNFKGNNAEGITGQQIELRTGSSGHYSFDARKGQSGKYFLQACQKRPVGSSKCTRWADFWWRASKN